jgi:hypothetical protein
MNDGSGVTITADRPGQVVDKLHQASRSDQRQALSRKEFREETALRAQEQSGKPVRADTNENFLADLIAVGLITEEK